MPSRFANRRLARTLVPPRDVDHKGFGSESVTQDYFVDDTGERKVFHVWLSAGLLLAVAKRMKDE